MTDKEVFIAALDLPAAEQAAFVPEKCGADAELRRRVEALLKAHIEAGKFFATSVPEAIKTEALLAAPPAFGRDQPGQVIAGRYKLIELIAEGGMGTVWMAEQSQPLRRLVAVKLIKPGMDSKLVLARFEAERQALAMMDHGNIAKILDGGSTSDGRPFFVMELVKGIPITQYCDERNLSIRDRLEVFAAVCSAVQHAHQKGILHRDLKPSNILVTEHDGKPVPKVIDFGLAKALAGPQALTDQTLLTAFGTVVGTPLYMAPEQVAINALDVDTRADIYALGVVLYELLTGTTPLEKERFRQAAWEEVKRLICEEDPPKPSTRLSATDALPTIAARRHTEPQKLGRALKGELDWIVMKALEKDRNRRYETASSLASDLQCYLRNEPVLAGPPSAAYRIRKFVLRHRGPVAAAAAVLLALIAGVIGTSWGLINARQERDRARAAQTQAETQRQLAQQERDRAQAALADAEKQRHIAQQERDIAKAVTEFLEKDLLGQAALENQPAAAGQRRPDLTVRELLTRASAEVDKKFKDQPLVEASLHMTLGDTLLLLGMYPAAEKHFLRALQIRGEKLGSDDTLTADTKYELGRLRQHEGRFKEAEILWQDAAAVFAKNKGADSPAALSIQLELADLYRILGRPAQAEALAREVLARRRATEGERSKATLAALHTLACAVHEQSRYGESESLHRQTLAGRIEVLGRDHPGTLATMGNLAVCLSNQKRYADAETLHREIVAVHMKNFGPDHPSTLTVKTNLALVLSEQRKSDEAEALYQEVLQLNAAKLGADHPSTLHTRHNLASFYLGLNKPERAEPLFRENLAGCICTFGRDHPRTLLTKAQLGDVLRDQRKDAEAEPCYRDALAAIDVWLQNPWDRAVLQFNFGVVLARQEKHGEAEPVLRAAFRAMTAPEMHVPQRQAAWPCAAARWLETVCRAQGKLEEAESWKVEAERRAVPTSSQPGSDLQAPAGTTQSRASRGG